MFTLESEPETKAYECLVIQYKLSIIPLVTVKRRTGTYSEQNEFSLMKPTCAQTAM